MMLHMHSLEFIIPILIFLINAHPVSLQPLVPRVRVLYTKLGYKGLQEMA